MANQHHVPYASQLTVRAKELRRNMTPAEKKLWYDVLSGRRFKGLKFLRQKPLETFIVDFYCSELKLAIEIDGESHGNREGEDRQRTERLERHGITVLRYRNSDVMTNLEGVYQDLEHAVATLGKSELGSEH